MVPQREGVPFTPEASMSGARPSTTVTMTITHGVNPGVGGPHPLGHSSPPPQWSSFPAAPRSHAIGPQRLHSALQPPPMHSGGSLRPSTVTSYRAPWTRHTSNSIGSSSSSGSYSANSRLSGSSSPRYADLIDAINEASIAGAVSTRRSESMDESMDGGGIMRKRAQPSGSRQPITVPGFDHPRLSHLPRRGSVEYDSPKSQSPSSRRSSPGHHQHQSASTGSSALSSPSSYPLAPKKNSLNQGGVSVEGGEQTNPPKKRVRYLRDTDRRNIIRRIENGEKQAALAREFGVTRAAICHIKKNRYEIISRYDLLVKTAKEMDKQESFGIPPGGDVMVHEVRSKSVLLLLTTLRDRRSPPSTFRRTAGRLIMILLEEAFASLESESVQVTTTAGRLYDGLQTKHQMCGIGIGSEGLPFLVLLNQMEPDAPRGSLKIELTDDYRSGQQVVHIENIELPPNVAEYKVFLFISTCSTGASVCKAIEILRDAGVEEHDISVVMIWCAADGLASICNRFPRVRVITAAIDRKTGERMPEGLGDFVSRYNDYLDPNQAGSTMAY